MKMFLYEDVAWNKIAWVSELSQMSLVDIADKFSAFNGNIENQMPPVDIAGDIYRHIYPTGFECFRVDTH